MHQRVALGVHASEGLLPLQLRPSRSVGEGGRTGRARVGLPAALPRALRGGVPCVHTPMPTAISHSTHTRVYRLLLTVHG